MSNGNHSLQMWHSNTDGYTNSKLSISVNGKKVLTGVNCPTNVKNVNDAGISYVTWSGSSITILITPEGGGKQNVHIRAEDLGKPGEHHGVRQTVAVFPSGDRGTGNVQFLRQRLL